MKAESLLLSDVITHTSHSSIILLGLSVCVCVCVCVWETEREDMYMKERGVRVWVHMRVGVLCACEREREVWIRALVDWWTDELRDYLSLGRMNEEGEKKM